MYMLTPKMDILAPKMYILTLKMNILAPKMHTLASHISTQSHLRASLFVRMCSHVNVEYEYDKKVYNHFFLAVLWHLLLIVCSPDEKT